MMIWYLTKGSDISHVLVGLFKSDQQSWSQIIVHEKLWTQSVRMCLYALMTVSTSHVWYFYQIVRLLVRTRHRMLTRLGIEASTYQSEEQNCLELSRVRRLTIRINAFQHNLSPNCVITIDRIAINMSIPQSRVNDVISFSGLILSSNIRVIHIIVAVSGGHVSHTKYM